MLDIRRRQFISLLGGAAAAWPLAARAQQADRIRRIAVLAPLAEDDPEMTARLAGFRQGLEKRGWSEGRNVRMDTRFAPDSSADQAQVQAKELIALQPDVILAQGTPLVAALQRETRTIPIVFASVADPIGSGFVASLPRPGGNVTGFTPIVGTLGGKWVELLKEIAPGVAKVILLFNPPTATWVGAYLNPLKAAAEARDMEALVSPVHDMPEVELLLTTQAREANSGLVVIPDAFTVSHNAEITSLAARFRVPAVYWSRSSTELGGLISLHDLRLRNPSSRKQVAEKSRPQDATLFLRAWVHNC